MSKAKRILVVRPDRIGDVVLSTPVVRELERVKQDKQVLQIAMDIAEQELGIDIRKKYLAKLSGLVGNKGQELVSGESEDCLASADKAFTNEDKQKNEKQKKPNR